MANVQTAGGIKIFGRQPLLYIEAIAAVFSLLVLRGVASNDLALAIVAALQIGSGLLVAGMSREKALPIVVAFGKAVLLVGVAAGWELTPDDLQAYVVIIQTLAAIFLWPKNSPVETRFTRA
jgi:hypothetical protein